MRVPSLRRVERPEYRWAMRCSRLMMRVMMMMSLSVMAWRWRHGVLAGSRSGRRPLLMRSHSGGRGRRDVPLVSVQRRRWQRIEVVLAAVVGRRRPSTIARPGRSPVRRWRGRVGKQAVVVPPVAVSRRRRWRGTRFQIIEVTVAEINLYHANVVAASAVSVRYQPKRVSPFLFVTPNVDHAAIAVKSKDDWSPRLAAFATVDGASRPRRS